MNTTKWRAVAFASQATKLGSCLSSALYDKGASYFVSEICECSILVELVARL